MAYFLRLDESRFRPTEHTGGGWDPEELHVSPLVGLVVHVIEGHLAARGGTGLAVSRISVDILGRLANDVCEVRVETLRPGRTIELIEAILRIGDRSVIRARAWLLAAGDTSTVAGGGDAPLPHPDSLAEWPMTSVWPGGYIASLEVRAATPPGPGRATAWVSSTQPLVDGEESSELASFVALIDTANGLAARESPDKWMYPNLDLTIHLHRQPEGRWVGLDSTAVFGSAGQGVTSTVLHDLAGPVGSANQILTVRAQG